jgi:hypothetical protein
METLIPILIQLIGGAAGGNVVGAALKKLDLNALLRTVLGAVGGVGGGQLAELIPALEGLLGGTDPGAMAGQAGAGAAGGAILTLIVGLIKQAMAKNAGPGTT